MLCDLSCADKVWAVLRSKPHKEFFVKDFLLKDGFETYFPVVSEKGKEEKSKPLFPGYLFVKISPRFELTLVKKTPNLLCPLMFKENLAVMEDSIIGEFKLRENSKGVITIEKPHPFKRGERVRIKEGSFAGIEAVVIEYLPEKERVRLLLDYFGREVRLETPESLLN
ncbi:MAG: hypothetical protein N2445_06635 [Acidobacteria bacterium]|nr:hypothetical protein [Acidobacteriota bacterium]